jgi:hypothetical protein
MTKTAEERWMETEERRRLFDWAMGWVESELKIEALTGKATIGGRAQRLTDAVGERLKAHGESKLREAAELRVEGLLVATPEQFGGLMNLVDTYNAALADYAKAIEGLMEDE